MLDLLDLLVTAAKWFSVAAGATLLFAATLVGALVWLLNRPLD